MGFSDVYSPFQTVGLVCDGASQGCAPVVHRQGLASFITTPVEGARTLHLYDTNLQLKGISKPIPTSWYEGCEHFGIDRIAAYQELTFAAVGNNIGVYHRLRPFGLWRVHQAPIVSFTVIGNVLISISEDGRVVVWRLPETPKDEPAVDGHVLSEFHIPVDFKVTSVCHPQTYVNKILLGSKDGRCMLVNFRTKKVIHTFPGFSFTVTVLEPSPVVDVIAVGTVDGKIHLHNFRVDETIVTYQQESDYTDDEEGGTAVISSNSVNTISFRTDMDESMMTGDARGSMFIWDLNRKLIRSEARAVHPGGGSSLAHFLPGEPLLITAGKGDNSIKVHIFDEENGQARILRSREGHYLPPTIVRFCGYDGFMMVSAGLDRELRLVSAVQQARNRSFSQKKIENHRTRAKKRRRMQRKIEVGDHRHNGGRRLPRISAFAAGNVRERDEDFANIVTIHEGLESAYTWRLQSGATHEHVLRPPRRPKKYELAFKRGRKESKKQDTASALPKEWENRQATSVVLSPCGNFAYIGGEHGRIHAYNLQSGRHQGVFEDPELASTASDASTEKGQLEWGRAHSCRVVGISVDACGDTLVSAGGEDRRIKFWTMYTRKRDGDSISTRADISLVLWSTTSDLLAVSCTDFVVYVYDAITRKLARCFSGHRGPVVDLCFDVSGRRILSASMDSTLKTWDLPSGRVFDTLHCDDAPTSIAVAPNGEYIATTHVNNLGVKLWVDMSRFGPVRRRVRKADADDSMGVSLEAEDQDTDADVESDTDSEMQNYDEQMRDTSANFKYGNESPLSDEIITLSTMPTSKWTVLSNLQAIKERNKPIEPAKKAESAPFFIPTKKSLHMEFDLNEGKKATSGIQEKIRRVDMDGNEDEGWMNGTVGKLMLEERFDDATRVLNTLDASGVDMEIRTMNGRKTLRNAAKFFKTRVRSTQGFEITQAHLGVFLRAHGGEFAKEQEGRDLLQELLDEQRQGWERLRELFDSVLSLSAHFSGQL
eukprot:TRINITY_DN267_c0_g3_i1.p1 TRINITY_DN267_c0_g3~~TRINITY_DN267_c0_g3_i1.p1  ORF type:complete len:995 (+),score=158.07 TRINITY_DN267_c0_g3_i1:6574-9558(+)